MAESTPRRRSDSVLVSLKELRNIETNRVEREEEEREEQEQRARAAREAQERAVREAQERRRQEHERREREARERQERIRREERLRLAEAERRARVEAELSLERKRMEMQMGSRPPRAEGRSAATPRAGAERQTSSRTPWLATAVATLVLGCVIALVSQKLHQETARAASLLDRIEQVKVDAAKVKRRAEERIASLDGQVADLQGRLLSAITAPKPEPAPKRPRRPRRPRRTKKKPDPTLSTECIGSTDVLCGVLDEKKDRKRR
jgi:hypothetical protein